MARCTPKGCPIVDLPEIEQTVWNAIEDWHVRYSASVPVNLSDLEQMTGLPRRLIRAAIKRLIEEFHLPIGSLSTGPSGGGYFVITSEPERDAVIAELQGRVDSLLARISAVEAIEL